jgi:hypothetical protein
VRAAFFLVLNLVTMRWRARGTVWTPAQNRVLLASAAVGTVLFTYFFTHYRLLNYLKSGHVLTSAHLELCAQLIRTAPLRCQVEAVNTSSALAQSAQETAPPNNVRSIEPRDAALLHRLPHWFPPPSFDGEVVSQLAQIKGMLEGRITCSKSVLSR